MKFFFPIVSNDNVYHLIINCYKKFFFSDFIENDLVSYAKENPGVVVYVKPRRHRGPVIKAEYCKQSTFFNKQGINK